MVRGGVCAAGRVKPGNAGCIVAGNLLANPAMKTALIVGTVLATLPFAAPVWPCGGFFCNRQPPNGPPEIAQVAENVAFAIDRDPATGKSSIEAHIQILYTGPADKFSWVVPTLALPTLEIGINTLFQRLEPQTRPQFSVRYVMEGRCKGTGSEAGCLGGSYSSAKATGGSGPGGVLPGGGVEVLSRANVGPYDAAVIRSEDPAALRAWLTANSYFVSAEAATIIDTYVAEHSFFVALRLQNGRDVQEIQPIVLKMDGEEACVPLRLTAIASVADLRVNVWVLANARAVPTNYIEVAVNPARIDWFNFGSNYTDLLKSAADEAGGNAFAVEYAGSTAMTRNTVLQQPFSLAQLGARTTPPAFVTEMQAEGIAIDGSTLPVLRRQIPMPEPVKALGTTEDTFYKLLDSYWAQYRDSFAPFDSGVATEDLFKNVLRPLESAQAMLNRHSYMTRLATFISPEEMTKDPFFVINSDLPMVSNQRQAVAHMICGDEEHDVCNAPVKLEVPDGGDIWFRPPATDQCNRGVTPAYARGELDNLPAAQLGWQRLDTGEGHLMLDNRTKTAELVAAHNQIMAPGDGGCGCSLRRRGSPLAAALVLGFLAATAWRRRRVARRPPRPHE